MTINPQYQGKPIPIDDDLVLWFTKKSEIAYLIILTI